jgi:hypothetical protein
MNTQTPSAPTQNAPKQYVSLPPEKAPEPFLSGKFVAFAIFVISIAAGAGLVQSGRISVAKYIDTRKVAAVAPFVAAIIPKSAQVPAVPAPPAGTFTVTSISIGDPSFAIINGVSRSVGDPVDTNGVTGWKVKQIGDEVVVLQNGTTVTSVPLTIPDGLKPLDDSLHPVN